MLRISLAIALLCNIIFAAEPNPPNWDTNVVKIFSPGQSNAQGTLNSLSDPLSGKAGCNAGQFTDKRYAFFFKPGQHNVNVNVGFYTSVYGLGLSPHETKI